MEVSEFEIVSNLEVANLHASFLDDCLFCQGGLLCQTRSLRLRSIRCHRGHTLAGVLLIWHACKLIDKVDMVEDVEEHLEELYQEK